MKRISIVIMNSIIITCVVIATVSALSPALADTPERWYEKSRVESGKKVYETNCASCHGSRGEATPNWRNPDKDGNFPPPPLNGTAHTWHHPFRVLAQQIKFGLPGGTGKMPPFKDILTDDEIINAIAWFQSLWSDEIYAQWWKIQIRSAR